MVRKALEKNCEARYHTAGFLLNDLKNLKQELEFEARLAQSVHQDLSSGNKHEHPGAR